ncbi:MAG: sensor histidine kinase [Candidatus Aminicenantes bacterium]|nr:sensor histidine kinase [Candidatus Aminicenantes bacterium]
MKFRYPFISICLLWIILLSNVTLSAVTSSKKVSGSIIDQWTTLDNFTQNSINRIIQSKDGYTVRPRFTQTIWFFLVMVVVLVFTGLALNSFRIGGFRRRKIELEKLVADRTEQLASKNRELRREVVERTKAEMEKVILLQEIHHRVKNNLTMISSLLNLQRSSVKDERVRDILKKTQDRIRIIAGLHERLCRSADLKTIDFGDYIRDLMDKLSLIGGIEEKKIGIEIIIPPLVFSVKTAIPLALIITELVSNAIEHAFGERDEGRVVISLLRDGKKHVLQVEDDGRGLAEDFDLNQTESLGLQLVSILTEQIGGTLQVQREKGTRFIIRFSPM